MTPMRAVPITLMLCLVAAALSGCLRFDDDCTWESHAEASGSGSSDGSYSYSYRHEHDQGGASGTHGHAHHSGHSHSASGTGSGTYASGSGSARAEADGCSEDEDARHEEARPEKNENVRVIASPDPPAESTTGLMPTIDHLYTGHWSGSGDAADTFRVAAPYEFLVTELLHQGQAAGDGFRYTDPEEGDLDHSCLTAMAGQTHITRTLPPTKGDARFTFDGRIAGQTTFDAWGYRGHPAPTLLDIVHQGQRADSPVPLGTTVSFYVPDGIDEITIGLFHQGQSLLGARLYDAEGDEVANLESGTGQESRSTTVAGTPGLWTLELDGLHTGQFQVDVHPTATDETGSPSD